MIEHFLLCERYIWFRTLESGKTSLHFELNPIRASYVFTINSKSIESFDWLKMINFGSIYFTFYSLLCIIPCVHILVWEIKVDTKVSVDTLIVVAGSQTVHGSSFIYNFSRIHRLNIGIFNFHKRSLWCGGTYKFNVDLHIVPLFCIHIIPTHLSGLRSNYSSEIN